MPWMLGAGQHQRELFRGLVESIVECKHVSEAQREFNEDVVGVNRGLAAAYNVGEKMKELALCDGACCGPREEASGSARQRPAAPAGPARLPRAPVWGPALTRFRGVRF